jgi:hypothetical protein
MTVTSWNQCGEKKVGVLLLEARVVHRMHGYDTTALLAATALG